MMIGKTFRTAACLSILSVTLLVGVVRVEALQPTATPVPEIHCKHFIHGYPTGAPATNDLVIRDLYALSSNDARKFADWVAYLLTPHEVLGTLDLERKWRTDPWLAPEETLEGEKTLDDYKNAHAQRGYDRGHQAPLGSFKGSRYASQVNFMSNITPQKSDLNQGPWKRLEGHIRKLVKKHERLWVMTGPLYEQAMPALPEADEPHSVPSGYWKIVVMQDDQAAHGLKVAAFLFDQDTPRSDPVIDHVATVREVEQRSGLQFFSELPTGVQDQIENSKATAWVAQW